MAVDANRVKGELRKLFPKVNLTTKRLDEISARLAKRPADDADDAAIIQVINDANEIYPFAEIAKDDDRYQTLKNKGKKSDDTKDQDNNPPNPKDDDENEPAWLKKLDAKFDSLTKELGELKQEKVITSKREEARKLFSTNDTFKGLSEKAQNHYLDQLKYTDETPIADQVTSLEEVVKDIVQVRADNTQLPGNPPKGGEPTAMSSAEMDKILKDIKA